MDYTSAIIHMVQKIMNPKYLAQIYALVRYLYIKMDSGNKKAQAPASNLDLG